MSVVFSGTLQGTFTSTGNAQIIQLPTGVDYIRVYNETVSYAGGANTGAEFYWQRGMAQGRGTIYTKTAATNALQVGQIAAQSGFYLIDTTVNVPGPGVATTGITGALPPVVTTGSTAGLNNGDIVRLFAPAGALQLGGMDFTIGSVVANTSFTLPNMPAIVAATPAAGIYRRIPYDPYFYPSTRYITKISQATQAIVTLSVTHNYTVGQVIRFVVPVVTAAAYGMSELNGLQGTIVAVNATDGTSTNTITVDIDTTGFTAFALPLTANPYHTFAQVIPVGESTRAALAAVPQANLLGGATENQALFGLQLMAGTLSPAGANGDIIRWVAGKSFNV
jgi:hypothetical protein